jgi:hypothetical protein
MGIFAVLRDITWTDEPLDSLVLSAKRKALIKALVGQHMKRAASYDDFVSGKGKVSQIGHIACCFSPVSLGSHWTSVRTSRLWWVSLRYVSVITSKQLTITPGKTLTAEAIAEKTRRVLYTVSAGELGSTPEQVDFRLTTILKLAESWEAVFLLDEVDVFLRKRGCDDVKRNAVVSIFLRQLEYFQGVLILTTNMIDQIDPAFESKC